MPEKRVVLRQIDEAAADAIVAGGCPDGYRCAADYPADGDRIAARLFLERSSAGLDPRPFGAFLVCLTDGSAAGTDLVIGGIGFHGGPDPEGRVEVGYGIVASHQGAGAATEALRQLMERASELGARFLTAETEEMNLASQAVLRHQNFTRLHSDGDTVSYGRPLGVQ